MTYLTNILVAVDQLANTLLGGKPDETLSAYAHRKQDWRRKAINALFFWQDDHCKLAYESERLRRHLPKDYT
jgi:hypothetical protein